MRRLAICFWTAAAWIARAFEAASLWCAGRSGRARDCSRVRALRSECRQLRRELADERARREEASAERDAAAHQVKALMAAQSLTVSQLQALAATWNQIEAMGGLLPVRRRQ